MVVEPKVKGFICTTAHPKGCEESVRRQIEYTKQKKQVEESNCSGLSECKGNRKNRRRIYGALV